MPAALPLAPLGALPLPAPLVPLMLLPAVPARLLFASAGGPALAGIAVNTSSYATDLDANLAAWRELVTAARASGLHGIPDPSSTSRSRR